jgi:hypothetical protein
MIATGLLALSVATGAFEVPLSGTPLDPSRIAVLQSVAGVEHLEAARGRLELMVRDNAEVRLRDLEAALAAHAPGTTVDRNRLPVTRDTIFELNAGQCFFCAEKPIGRTLSHLPYVADWAVVDYVTKGRMRFRVEPKGPLTFQTLEADPFEDVIFTHRYSNSGWVNLYWPTGGIAWRADEASARREATATKKPLMIFPTAGT